MSINEIAPPRTHFTVGMARPSVLFDSPELAELLPIAIYACDADGRILWFNRKATDLWGRTPRVGQDAEQFCGSYRLYFRGKLTPSFECPMAHVLRTGEAVRGVEGLIERPDGSRIWATVHIEPIEDGSGVLLGAINCFHETTETHRAHEDLQDFFDNSPVAMHLVGPDGTILRANPAELGMLGYTAEEYIGRNIIDFHVDRSTIDDILNRLICGNAIHSYPARLRAKDGSIRNVQISSSARMSDGQFVNTRCCTIDVTQQLVAEMALAKRAEEQAALYAFTDRLQRAASLDDVYEAALDAIIAALKCDRASILIFDRAGMMRFAAWRGLSEKYRRAVEGHSPWSPDTKDPQPLVIANIQQADLSVELKQTVASEGISALAFIPLMENGRLLGKFMTYYGRPHDFAASDNDAALAIARHLGFAVERVRGMQAAQHLAAIVESSSDSILSIDLDGVIRSWNRGAERIFGYSAEETIGRPVTILIPPGRLDEEPEILARVRLGDTVDHYETVRQRKDGTLVDISLTVSPVRDAAGRIVGASKISRDISDRKRAEERLRDSERRLHDLLEGIPAAIYTTDAEGRITYFNQAAVSLAGRTPTVGTDEWCVTWKLYRTDGSPLPHDQCPMAIALKEGRPVRGVEAIAERPDGTRIPFIPFPTPIRDAKGNVTGAVNMLVDISERKEAEAHQRMLLNELNHRVKNNMQMMQSLLDAASRRVRDKEARSALDEAGRRIAAMAAAQRVLYGTTHASRFDASEFLAAVCKTVEETLPIPVSISTDGSAGELLNDVAMPLALIVNELLTNAAKHAQIGQRAAVVRASLVRSDGAFLLTVEDDGQGFDLQEVRTRSSGLRLVQGLARQLRGGLEVLRDPTRCVVRFEAGH
jgi:PAS domain S-box-containing protein